MKLAVLLIAVVALTTGAPADSEQRIIDGTVETAAVPYLVAVRVNDKYVCGGFIYKNGWVVTAASCLGDALPSQVKVVVGEVSFTAVDPKEETINVFKLFIYNTATEGVYDPVTKLHDIALLQLSDLINAFGTSAAAIPYDEVISKSAGKFAGWGATADGGSASIRLRSIELTIPATCGTYTTDEYKPSFMFCAGDSTKDTGSPCQYDEGSPFVQTIGGTEYVVGIMSKNKGCATNFEPTIFTRLTSYYAWLHSIAGMQTL